VGEGALTGSAAGVAVMGMKEDGNPRLSFK
jgi:hypothetical protein